MKQVSTILVLGLLFISLFLFFNSVFPQQALAQEPTDQTSSENFSREELAQMLAPIALYPDTLLSQVLMASTYPIEVIEADRWVKRNPDLKDEQLDNALEDQDWDPSVKAICHFPSILALMSDNISETVNIGNAFLAQEDEVMDTIQELRHKAYEKGNLDTTREQKVIVKKETIIIEPADPRVYYVPYYDPLTIYGTWWYPAYPPYYWGPPGISIGIGISYWPAFYFGFAFGTWSYFDWPYHHIYIDVRHRPRYVRHDRWPARSERWSHRPEHRRGVAYRDKPTARRYGQQPRRNRDYHPDTRGFPTRRTQERNSERQAPRDRSGAVRDRTPEERSRTERQQRQQAEGSRREQQPRTERQQSQQVERPRIELQQRQRAEGDRREQRPESSMPERTRIERNKLQIQDTDRERRTEQWSDRQRQSRQETADQQEQRRRENVFNRVDNGNWERRSSERGWQSRQGGRSGSDNSRGGRDNGRDRSRNR